MKEIYQILAGAMAAVFYMEKANENMKHKIFTRLGRREGSKWTVALMVLALWLGIIGSGDAWTVRIKDVTHIEGMRENQLIGYGLVVGLSGTGDGTSTEFTVQSLVAFLRRKGVTIDPGLVKVENIAAVIVTAQLPPFARPGSTLDVTVSSIGDAESLLGGTLVMTDLMGADEQVYAVAQGAVSVGGFGAGGGGTTVTKNHTTAGKVPGGALIERAPPTVLAGRDYLNLILDNPDYTTAGHIAEVLNQNFDRDCAQAVDAANVRIRVPEVYRSQLADFLAELERLPVHPDQRARIIVDERTGTVVMGEDVRISTLAISHGNLSIQVTQTNEISQPGPFSPRGRTEPFSQVDVAVQEEGDNLSVVPEGVSLGEIVQSLNAIGVTPRDLISILQSIKAVGALQAELIIR